MGRIVLLLRGINVGGRNRLPMAEWRAQLQGLGAEWAVTYVQSGNAVAQFEGRPPDETELAEALRERFDLDVPVVVRGEAQWAALIEACPFDAEAIDPSRLHVGFLQTATAEVVEGTIDLERSPPDQVAVTPSEIYLHAPNGVARTKYTNAYFDRRLGTVTTFRNWRTVLAIADLLTGQRGDSKKSG